eukprot:CAMPEP_0201487288 /NCGR_PEP_ID=MMETSP0151_2-20130828/12193_1 /ASSEMBLY_ACC=CAM_ASM_000257 /TAXON_ID=200890 /ORGANISM="Paramoeba atlantica, Strain 621/1 / CCAP 1560/9" /LENGTH=323 /DNA_ID=CAMNT_0047872287 /DNA_START=13 /DNA_END=984 /DNA_ORIENTATION=+
MAEEKENKKVCIFGANGFIGSHITKHLLEKGYTVIAITRSPPEEEKVSFLSRKENFPEQERLSLLQCSTDDTKELVKRMGGCKSCIIASGINDPAYETWPEEMVQLTENVLNCCSEVGVERVVLLTSTGTTNPREGEPLEKKEDVHFSDPVLQREQGKFASCAKTLAEQKAFELGKKHGIRVCAICPSAVLGPRFDSKPCNDFIVRLLKGERKWEKIPNGSMSFVDVRDLAKLHVAAMENEKATGRFFGVCSNSAHFSDIANHLHENYPSFLVPPLPDSPLVRPTHFDFTKQKSLGVECRSVKQILKEYVDYLIEQGTIAPRQ